MFEQQILTASTDFFNELFFGQGAWLGLIIILGIMFLIAIKVKYFGLIAFVATLFLGIQYFNEVSTSSNLMWCGVLCFVCLPFFIVVSVRGRFDI